MSPPLEPVNSELVAVAWAQSLPGVDAVSTSLPGDVAGWWETGFVTVDGVVGGTPLPDVPQRMPVVQYSFWAANPGSSTHPPWSKAFVLAERLVRCTESDSAHRAGLLVIRTPFEQATLHDATTLIEPRRFPTPDPAGFARVTVDVQLIWTRFTIPEVHT